MKNRHILAATTALYLIAAPAFAAPSAPATTINALPDSGNVMLSGTVDSVRNDREFTLRDATGTVDVKLPANQSAVLQQGETVAVSGNIESSWLGKDINATSVERQSAAMNAEKAQTVQISQLPKQGLVKLTGTVDSVGSGKSFTLKDPTGKVDVSMQSSENVALMKGSEVSVIGYVDNSMLGKKLRATHVSVVAEAAPAADMNNPQ